MGGGKGGGGGSSQIAEGGFPEELKPFIMNTIIPFAQQWVQGQQAFPGSTNPGYLASGIDWGGKTKAPWMDEWNYNPGKITLGQARQSAYPEPKKTTISSTQQNITSPIFGSGYGVTGWQGSSGYPWSSVGSGNYLFGGNTAYNNYGNSLPSNIPAIKRNVKGV